MSDPSAMLSMSVEPDLDADGHQGLALHGLGQASVSVLAEYLAGGGALEDVVRVRVDGADGPNVAGSCQLSVTGLRLIPFFPFQPGLAYRAIFDPGVVPGCRPQDALHLVFCLPSPILPPHTVVDHVFPSGDCLPANLFRFYVHFSNPMQRGHAETDIVLLGPDGDPAADVFYRPPAELWDPTMRVLTLLLDPGRLKRGVGPNRELGPPLEPGQTYTLVVDEGMTDKFGRQLGVPARKRFTVGPAAREPVAMEAWTVRPPPPGSRDPLTVMFPAALDWAMLFNAITVVTATGEPVRGHIVVGEHELQWQFTPSAPWATGTYLIQVESSLEDSCGNTPLAAFDRPYRTEMRQRHETGVRHISFTVA